MYRIWLTSIVVASLAPSARAAPCMPAAVARGEAKVQLAVVAGIPILCAARDGTRLGCWDVDLKSARLTADRIDALPGRSIEVTPDAQRCVEGLCLSGAGASDERVLRVGSTDGARVAIVTGGARTAHVFDATSKKLLRTFELSGDTPETIIGNSIVGLLYIGNMIYARGADAGPNESVFAIRDDGTHLGPVTDEAGDMLSIDEGAASALDAERLALTDAFFQHLVVVSASDNRRTVTERPFAFGPCSQDDLAPESLSRRCKKHFAKVFAPYSGAEVVALPNGDLVVALSARASGQLAILDGKTLRERRRVRLPICRR